MEGIMKKILGVISLTCVMLFSGLAQSDAIHVGVPKVAAAQTTYTVVKGDTLYRIAAKYHLSVTELKSLNGLKSDIIYIGQKTTVSKSVNVLVSTPTTAHTTSTSGVKVKGVFMSGHSASLDSKFNEMVRLVDTTELNALVIDVKEDGGYVTYDSSVPKVNQWGSDKKVFIKDIKQRMKVLDDKKIYTIGRIVTFKDPYLAKSRPEFAIKKKDGSLYYDNGIPWVDPYKKSYWEYVVSIAKEAAQKGFDEIQFDYVRFPTNGNYVNQIAKFDNQENKTKSENIRDFLLYAIKELKPYGVKVSADIFGIATSDKSDVGIGQQWETLTQTVGILSPMMYPSHYGPGVYGLPVPDANPYETIKRGLKHAKDREKGLIKQGIPVASIRPWFQDFTAPYVKGHIVYGSKQVKDQIRAAKEYGIEEYMLWNARNQYSINW
jgi:hypothetical protein